MHRKILSGDLKGGDGMGQVGTDGNKRGLRAGAELPVSD